MEIAWLMREYRAFLCVAQVFSLMFARKLGNVIAAMMPMIVKEIKISAIVNAIALRLRKFGSLEAWQLGGFMKSAKAKSHDNRLVCFSRP